MHATSPRHAHSCVRLNRTRSPRAPPPNWTAPPHRAKMPTLRHDPTAKMHLYGPPSASHNTARSRRRGRHHRHRPLHRAAAPPEIAMSDRSRIAPPTALHVTKARRRHSPPHIATRPTPANDYPIDREASARLTQEGTQPRHGGQPTTNLMDNRSVRYNQLPQLVNNARSRPGPQLRPPSRPPLEQRPTPQTTAGRSERTRALHAHMPLATSTKLVHHPRRLHTPPAPVATPTSPRRDAHHPDPRPPHLRPHPFIHPSLPPPSLRKANSKPSPVGWGTQQHDARRPGSCSTRCTREHGGRAGRT